MGVYFADGVYLGIGVLVGSCFWLAVWFGVYLSVLALEGGILACVKIGRSCCSCFLYCGLSVQSVFCSFGYVGIASVPLQE